MANPSLTLERGLLGHGHIPNPRLTSGRGLLGHGHMPNDSLTLLLGHGYMPTNPGLTLERGPPLLGHGHMPNPSLTLERGLVGHGHMSNPSLRLERGTVSHGDMPNPSLILHVDAREVEKVQENANWETLSMQDAMASLEQRVDFPSIECFICIIEKSRKAKNLEYAKAVHIHVCQSGLEAFEAPGNHLVPMFVECRSISDAQQAFNKIMILSEHSWTFLTQGYIACGKSQHALILFQSMQEDCVSPSKYTYVAALKACARIKCALRGQEIHTEVTSKGLERDPFVGNMVVDMYVKCGLLLEASQVFNKLPVRDVVSWNVLIGGYVENGLGEEALKYLDQMNQQGVPFDVITFACSLKACRDVVAIDKGQEIHAEITKEGFETDAFVCSVLVDMYAKCGSLANAQDVFDTLPHHDVVAWTALIAGYVEGGLAEDALNCLEQMQLEGISPDAVTFVFFLKACGNIGSVGRGHEIHGKIAKGGFEKDSFVGNTLVSVYISCGALAEACDVFGKLPVRDVVSWNALIAAYTEQGYAKDALNCWGQMKLEGNSPDAVTFISSLKACGLIGALDTGREIHVEIAKEGFERDFAVGDILVDMYAKCGSLIEAQEVFDELPFHSVISWTVLIAGYADYEFGVEALNCLKWMQLDGVPLNIVTFVCSLKACGCIRAIDRGQDLHMEIAIRGFDKELIIGNTLVDMYAKCGSLIEAKCVFNKLLVQDVVSWNALISGYAHCGLDAEAHNCFQQMQLKGVSPDEVSWNAVILGNTEQEAYEKPLKLYEQMQEQGFLPDEVTFLGIMKACGSIGALEAGRKIHAQIFGFDAIIAITATVLIDMYGKCGSMVEAQEVFDTMPRRDVVTWNVLITNYARQGENDLVLTLFGRMREVGTKPDGITFLGVLNMCSHAGIVDEGQKYYEAMGEEYGITATIEHHNCMVDLLGRAGQLNEAVCSLETLPIGPDFVSWSTLLGACHKWNNVELGRHAFEWAVVSAENHASAFVLMSNMYGD